MAEYPKIEGALGITWRKRLHGWECRWRARADLVQKGYRPKNVRLFLASPGFSDLGPDHCDWIRLRANELQDEMMEWARGGVPKLGSYDGTIKGLVEAFQNDSDSIFHKKRYVTKKYYLTLCARVVADCGNMVIADMEARDVLRLHEKWSDGGAKIPMGHAVVRMLRTLLKHGATLLELKEHRKQCKELKSELSDMRFEMGKRRGQWVTAEQATAIRKMAHVKGWPSIALTQAFQFECMLRQKDVIGERVPLSEPILSDVVLGNEKWVRGIRWEEIDAHFVLKHITSKKGKPITIPVGAAPMVAEELRIMAGLTTDQPLDRALFPASGPVVIREETQEPWADHRFRNIWRSIAKAAGVPNNVYNMDSRAGGITEGSDAGVPMEYLRQAATHSDEATTRGYSRNPEEKTAETLRLRVEHRNKPRTE